MSTQYGSSQPGPMQDFSQPQYRCCGEDFSSWISNHEHSTKSGRKCETCGRKLLHLEGYDKHLDKHERELDQLAASDFFEPLVSPEVQKLESILAQEILEESLRRAALEKTARMNRERAERRKKRAERKQQQEEKAQQETDETGEEAKRIRIGAKTRRAVQEKFGEAERKEEERKRLEVKTRRQEAKRRRLSEKPIKCHLCSKRFKTPAAYAQHLESSPKNHPKVNRHHVTQAVNMLNIIPSITLAPSIGSEYQPSTLDHKNVTSSSAISQSTSPPTSVPSSPRTDMDASWILLGDEESVSGSVVLASLVSTAMSRVAYSPPPPHTFSPEPITYTPNDFANLGIPYACGICFKTFRTVVRLTQHMNSPVHDPDAFKCPKPDCGSQFALVSGLIQHLESGTRTTVGGKSKDEFPARAMFDRPFSACAPMALVQQGMSVRTEAA
ncbi:hypothetical protein FA13DRAFT_516698 [Coprinellus micaceus]|uniref:C2H2-type domain-containing protein n=1 Tax=Coprinellus micaceus TaxID=71717 RepID=A0A4Y7SD97_COPMI|nr:hypothetical protein FA13DRAFT_516698 [Coprinellus micaceus]